MIYYKINFLKERWLCQPLWNRCVVPLALGRGRWMPLYPTLKYGVIRMSPLRGLAHWNRSIIFISAVVGTLSTWSG